MPDLVCFYATQSSNIHSQWIKTNFASSKCYLHFSGVVNRFCRLFTCRKLQVFFLFSKLLSYSQCFECMNVCVRMCAFSARTHTLLYFALFFVFFLPDLFVRLSTHFPHYFVIFYFKFVSSLNHIVTRAENYRLRYSVYVVCPNILESLALNSPLFNRYEWCA